MQLVEEATEGCWIGHRARMFTSEIGSVYSPPKQDRQAIVVPNLPQQVETVIDIAHNERVGFIFAVPDCRERCWTDGRYSLCRDGR